jgi:hypothetical protein
MEPPNPGEKGPLPMKQNEDTYFKRGLRILNKNFVIDPNEFPLWNLSYSMQGEDLVVRALLKGELKAGKIGFYVDLGAYTSRYGSNTYLFYQYGWRGICVEPNPAAALDHMKVRPRDIFVSAAVGEAGPGYWAQDKRNPASSHCSKSRDDIGPGCREPMEIFFVPLKTIFDDYLPPQTQIDLMSIDVEEGEMSALRSNDWMRYRPRIIIIEVNDLKVANLDASPTLAYLRDLEYEVVAALPQNVILMTK